MAAMKMRMEGVLVLLVALMASQYFSTATADQVDIINGLGQDLGVHCASQDEDFGFRTMISDSSWEFSISPNLLRNTIFACDFESSQYPAKHITVYEGASFHDSSCLCTTCIWVVSPNGFDCNHLYRTGWN